MVHHQLRQKTVPPSFPEWVFRGCAPISGRGLSACGRDEGQRQDQIGGLVRLYEIDRLEEQQRHILSVAERAVEERLLADGFP